MKYTLKKLPQGWHWQEDPGHGWLHVSDDAMQNVPEFLREHHPFEEDCAYSIPVVFNKEMFEPETGIRKSMRRHSIWFWNEAIVISKMTITGSGRIILVNTKRLPAMAIGALMSRKE